MSQRQHPCNEAPTLDGDLGRGPPLFDKRGTTPLDARGQTTMRGRLIALALGVIAAAGRVQADNPARIVIAFPPGGPVDLVAPILAEGLGQALKQTMIVENKP